MKTQIQKKSHKNKVLITTIIVATLVLVTGTYYAYASNIFGWRAFPAKSTIDYNSPTQSQINDGASVKNSNPITDSSPEKGNDSSTTPTTGKVAVSASSVNVSEGVLQIRFLINAVTNDGTCKLTLTNPSAETIITAANVQASASSTTCRGFNVQVGSGTWTYSLVFKNSTISGSATGTFKVS